MFAFVLEDAGLWGDGPWRKLGIFSAGHDIWCD